MTVTFVGTSDEQPQKLWPKDGPWRRVTKSGVTSVKWDKPAEWPTDLAQDDLAAIKAFEDTLPFGVFLYAIERNDIIIPFAAPIGACVYRKIAGPRGFTMHVGPLMLHYGCWTLNEDDPPKKTKR